MPQLQELVEQFRQHGYKMTPQRRAIIEVIADCTSSHPTADQIYERVTARMPDISVATVYNTLRELVAVGQVYELNVGQGMRHYELSHEEHIHLVCIACGMIRDAPADLGQLKVLVHHNSGFQPVRHDVTIFGYCAACAPED